jgi:hypothetical protein
MSNAFMGQRQSASPMGFGGFGGFGPQPFSPFSGGYGGGMGGFGMGGGGYDMGYGGSPLLPPPQPTVNDLFSQYFSQQYYGGPAFNPFAATSFFGGGFGGGFGFGGGGRRGRGGRMRPQPMPVQDDMMYAGGSPGFYSNQQPATIGAPPPSLSQLFAGEFSPMQFGAQQQRAEVGPQAFAEPPPVTMPAKFAEPLQPAMPSQLPSFGNFETVMPMPIEEPPVYAAPASFGPFGRGMARGGFR